VDSFHCQLYLFHASGPYGGSVTLDLAEKQLEVGRSVDGPGKLELQVVGPRHAKFWRDKSGTWFKALDGQSIWLNSVPVSTRAKTRLFKGDSLVFGQSPKGPEFWLLCRRAREADEVLLPAGKSEREDGGDRASPRGFSGLSRAEYDVIAWMARGVVEVDDISRQLFRSVNTVRTQLSKIYEKIGVHSRAELLGVLIRNANSLDRQKRNVSRRIGDCPCSNGLAIGGAGGVVPSKSEPAASS
jgi:DNA-binding CsgD family transcriptional regulator